jgi:hypothetical protein
VGDARSWREAWSSYLAGTRASLDTEQNNTTVTGSKKQHGQQNIDTQKLSSKSRHTGRHYNNNHMKYSNKCMIDDVNA